MKAKELAEMLLEHPDYTVKVGVEKFFHRGLIYGFDDIEKEMIETDDSMSIFYLGDYA